MCSAWSRTNTKHISLLLFVILITRSTSHLHASSSFTLLLLDVYNMLGRKAGKIGVIKSFSDEEN